MVQQRRNKLPVTVLMYTALLSLIRIVFLFEIVVATAVVVR